MLRTLMAGAAAIAAFLPTPASAQINDGISLFSRGHFKGTRNAIAEPAQFGSPLVVRSLVVAPGTQWELCSGNTYTGCRQVSGSIASMVMTVRSARPVANILSASAARRSGGTGPGPSLRGMASEYFVTPGGSGQRVVVQPATPESASRRAGEFCRSRGWKSSAYERLQPVGGQVYLADVLCADAE